MTEDRQKTIDDFLKSAGWGAALRAPLPGDASTRRYIRLERRGAKAILMDQPQGAEAPVAPPGATAAERKALGYNAVARLAGADCGRFVAAARFLRSLGLSAPEIYAADLERGLLIIEDLGDALYADVLEKGADAAALYGAAAEVLAEIHAVPAPAMLKDRPLYAYDEAALLAEVDLLTEWFYPLAFGRPIAADLAEEHRALWRAALSPFLAGPRVFVHRDYHAQNLLWLAERAGAARVGLIDFQDAVAGSRAYDLVSLTEDARRDVPADLAAATTARYLAAMRDRGIALDEAAFAAERAAFAAQRNAKIAGIFARLYKRDGKARYLGYLPRVWSYLSADLEHPTLAALKKWYDRTVPTDERTKLRREGE